MTGPARMQHAIAATIIASFLGVLGYTVWRSHEKNLPRLAGEWSTHQFADPVELIAGESTIRVSRFVLNFERESLTLERDELAFNDYGDATRTGGQEPLTLRVQFSREDTNRFEIILKNGFRQRFRLVVSPPPANTHRLIVLGRSRGWDLVPQRILELGEPEIVQDELDDRPQPEKFHFDALGCWTREFGGRKSSAFHEVSVSGIVSVGGRLYVDWNDYTFHPDGSITSKTQAGFGLHRVVFKPLGPDPDRRGRRAYELVRIRTNLTARALWQDRSPDFCFDGKYVIVLGPTELSQHRILVKSDGQVRQVLRLRDAGRDNHRRMLRQLDEVPADEQQAYRELAAISGYQTSFTVSRGHVLGIYCLEGNRNKLNSILARFPHLSQVHFMDGETRKLP